MSIDTVHTWSPSTPPWPWRSSWNNASPIQTHNFHFGTKQNNELKCDSVVWIDGRSADSQRPDHNGQTIPGPQLEQFIVLYQIAGRSPFWVYAKSFRIDNERKVFGICSLFFFLWPSPSSSWRHQDRRRHRTGSRIYWRSAEEWY